jgi:uncharacterized membrane-anchored protein
MKKVWLWLVQYGNSVMIGGALLLLVAVLTFLANHRQVGPVRTISYYTAWAGFAIYIAGRILQEIRKRRRKKPPSESTGDVSEDS